MRKRNYDYWLNTYPNLVALAMAQHRVSMFAVASALEQGVRDHGNISDDDLLADVIGFMPQRYTHKLS